MGRPYTKQVADRLMGYEPCCDECRHYHISRNYPEPYFCKLSGKEQWSGHHCCDAFERRDPEDSDP